MSEFYFDYRCVSMAGNKTSSLKALDFYLFQNYGPRGAMTVQIHVPEELQSKYCGARVYARTAGVDLPDDLEGLDYQYVPCRDDGKKAEYLISDDNCIFLQGESGEISGTGVIAFIEGNRDNPPLLENMYKYSVNFVRKDMITYRIIEEGKSWMRIEVVYNVLRKDTDLLLVKKTGSKPILVDDCKKSHCVMDGDAAVRIHLKASMRKGNRTSATVRTPNVKGDDYRLIFEEEGYNEYYMLVDDSDFTIEDRKIRRNEINSRERPPLDKVSRCPFCGRDIVPCKSAGREAIVTCDGKVLPVGIPENLKGRVTTVCGADLNDITGGVIPVNHLILPQDFSRKPSMNIVTVGFPQSGKTIFLSSLFNIKGNADEPKTSNSHIFSKIAEAYGSKKDQSVALVPYYNLEVEGSTATVSNRYEISRSRSKDNVLKRYSISVGDMIESHTPVSLAERLSWNPIGFKIGSLGHAFFYDVPGELFTSNQNVQLHCFDVADCFIAVMDGAKSSDEAVSNVSNALEKLREMSGKRSDFSKMPIAVVFTKQDMRLVEYSDTDRKDIGMCFDPNCHVTIEDMTSLMFHSRRYKGSELELHVERSSYELEHFLRSGNSDTVAKYNMLKKTYSNLKFFTCSALGKNNSLGGTVNQLKKVLYKPRRLRLELPIIWLMYQKGLIKR